MLKESGRIVAIDTDGVWVETTNKSVCGSCAAEKGCGQSLLARWANGHGYLKVLFDGRDPTTVHINDEVDIGIPEDVVVTSSLVIYVIPLVLMLVGAVIGDKFFSGEITTVIGAIVGFSLGSVFVFIFSRATRHNRRIQPVLLDIINNCQPHGPAIAAEIHLH